MKIILIVLSPKIYYKLFKKAKYNRDEIEINTEYYSNYKKINYGSKYYAKQKNKYIEKEDITTEDKDDENYEILGLKEFQQTQIL